ncbi:MAG: FAD-dependent oxidoreductase [Anaerolineae bacterium]|nr:FAD-dependent oxidoreductase [Anaerolineae bacterium]
MLNRAEMESFVPRADADYGVIVAGGGPAGLGAALAAAMNGARTLLLESRSFFGGIATTSPWMPVNRLMLEGGRRGGAHDLFVEKVLAYGEDASLPGRANMIDGDGLNIHPDYLRIASFEALEAAGCHYRLYSPVTGVVMHDNLVRGVTVTTKMGTQVFTADVTVDATGDGDVAFHAGAEMVLGREEDGRSMPVSLVFALANVDVDRFFTFISEDRTALNTAIDAAADAGYAVAAWYSFNRGTVPGVLGVNNGALRDIGNLDGTQAQDLTVAERAGIQVAADFVRLARDKRIPGLESCHLMRVGATVGVRDTRRLVGEYVVTVEDARTAPDFPDVVARKYGAIDANQLFIGEMASGFGYPYRSMLPKGIDGLLVAGRCGSATFLGHAAGKSMGNMMELGQAAGTAAALCSAAEVSPRELDVVALQARLREMGVHI